ncbi:MAG: hypothetical protein NZM29_05900, partial [Nitrospira sp.]|nr:hypothetical protein [Nitrospira sp.]
QPSALLGTSAEPFVNVASEKAPVLSNLGGRQFAEPGKLVHRGFGYPKKTGHVHHGQDLAVRFRGAVHLRFYDSCWFSFMHGAYSIGGTIKNLSAGPAAVSGPLPA